MLASCVEVVGYPISRVLTRRVKEFAEFFQIFESQLKIRYIVTIYGKSKIGRLSAMLDNAESAE